ncbi:hypothetical protein O181_039180 [Austropuccinia psidii MF-1]|uniref:Uncharacterized protein n=1 Tax=Austropuccinia psidii MF-1 TaxID=1389203 RepID=A0A9Q3HEW8_9BASI|nr:hypothetical protein [Austropuccinia psidii MF-1]
MITTVCSFLYVGDLGLMELTLALHGFVFQHPLGPSLKTPRTNRALCEVNLRTALVKKSASMSDVGA